MGMRGGKKNSTAFNYKVERNHTQTHTEGAIMFLTWTNERFILKHNTNAAMELIAPLVNQSLLVVDTNSQNNTE